MKHAFVLLIGFLLFGCNSSPENDAKQNNSEPTENNTRDNNLGFNFFDYKIMSGQLGSIKIGMTIQEAESQFSGLVKKVDEATNFGFGGGSPAYLYYSGEELIFGLIPKLGTDTLLFIIAAHKDLKTINGINPGSTINELLKTYPDMTVNKDLMNGWEFFQDETNNWDFIFITDEKTEIGEYPELEVPSKPKRLTAKTDWITIQ